MDNVHKQSKNKLLTEASSFSQNKHLKIPQSFKKTKKQNKRSTHGGNTTTAQNKYKKTHYELYLFPSLTKMPEINEDFN